MPVEMLTTRRVETARAVGGKLLELRDTKATGLELRVSPGGTRSWSYLYTRKSDGKRRRTAIGPFPGISLDDARRRALDLAKSVHDEGDPAAERQTRREALTFQEMAERRLAEDADIGASTRQLYAYLLKANAYAVIGSIPAVDVKPEHVVDILDKVEGRGVKRQADLTKSAIGSCYKWARRRLIVKADPTAGLGKRAASVARDRVPTTDELVKLWAATEDADAPLSLPMRRIMQLAILTGQRRTEVAGVRGAELRLGSDAPVWTIPGDSKRRGKVIEGRTKNGKEQSVMLSRQAAAVFADVLADVQPGQDHLFPADMGSVKKGKAPRTPHINGDSVSRAMRRVRAELEIDDITTHDMRRAIATWMGEQGVRPDVIDLVLNHLPARQDVTRTHYNLSQLAPMVRQAMQAWADHVWEITGQSDTATNVVKLRA